MRATLRPALVLLALLTLLTGVVYPLLVTGVAQLAFPRQARGSLVRDGERAIGSSLIGQPFADPGHFWSRPSATAAHPYDGAASTGSNLGPSNPALADAVRARITTLAVAGPAPMDLVTSSASGLDPHISPAAAHAQVDRIARARGRDPAALHALVDGHVEPRTFGLLGEARVNVLALNLELDRDGR